MHIYKKKQTFIAHVVDENYFFEEGGWGGVEYGVYCAEEGASALIVESDDYRRGRHVQVVERLAVLCTPGKFIKL